MGTPLGATQFSKWGLRVLWLLDGGVTGATLSKSQAECFDERARGRPP